MSQLVATARPLRLVTLCTGNAVRSVIAGAILHDLLPTAEIRTAGTLVIEHQPMSIRTSRAIEHLGLTVPAHRSHQLTDDDVAWADLVIAMAAEHVAYVRRRHPAGAARTATVWWLARHLPAGPGTLADRVGATDLTVADLAEQGDVVDPAGGSDEQYLACADELSDAIGELVRRIRLVGPAPGAGGSGRRSPGRRWRE